MLITPRTRILVVDDFASMREMMIKALNSLGMNDVLQAEDGEIALRALTNIEPPIELVISDWNMPNLNGIELLKKVRAHHRLRHLPFILVTTEGEKENVIEAVQAGVTNYIVKPFTA